MNGVHVAAAWAANGAMAASVACVAHGAVYEWQAVRARQRRGDHAGRVRVASRWWAGAAASSCAAYLAAGVFMHRLMPVAWALLCGAVAVSAWPWAPARRDRP